MVAGLDCSAAAPKGYEPLLDVNGEIGDCPSIIRGPEDLEDLVSQASPRKGSPEKAPTPPSISGDGGDIVQFSTQVFYADEADGYITIGVMRLGAGKGRVRVAYYTADGSAKAGDQYQATSGALTFEDGEKDKQIEITIIDDDTWHATNEFKVHLKDPEGCSLGNYLHTARVKVLDQNTFPSDKYAEATKQGKDGIALISGIALFWEYFKLNFQQQGMWWRTMLTVIFDQLHNINVLLQTWMSMYMVDVVFNSEAPASELKFGTNRIAEVYILAFLNILPILMMHLWDSIRVKIDLGGHSEAFLRANIVRRYMNLTEDSRIQLDASRLQVAILDDTQKIALGYCSVLDMVKSMGTVSVLTIFTLHSNRSAWWIVISMPLLMVLFMVIRDHFSVPHDDTHEKKALIQLLNEMLKNFKLIISYYQRPRINEMVMEKVHGLREKKIPIEQEGKHDEYFPQWMGAILTAAYIVISGPIVLSPTSHISLGSFLATISIIRDIAGAFSLLYSVYMKLSETFDPVREITWVFSLKTDLMSWKAVSKKRQEMTILAREEMRGNTRASTTFPVDRLKVFLRKVRFYYQPGKTVLRNIDLSVSQGNIVALMGSHNSGKSTTLQIIGHSLFPVSGDVFVPGHLRILLVDVEVLIFESWTPLDNLTFGLAAENVDLQQVRAVLENFQMKETWRMVQEESPTHLNGNGRHARMSRKSTFSSDAFHRENTGELTEDENDEVRETSPWYERLSQTEKYKIGLARALIANPEVLILHKPFRNFSTHERTHMMEVILKHVQCRGIGLNEETASLRRPRTCFYSVVNETDTYIADVVWRIEERSIVVDREHSEYGTARERLSRISQSGQIPAQFHEQNFRKTLLAPGPQRLSDLSDLDGNGGDGDSVVEDDGYEPRAETSPWPSPPSSPKKSVRSSSRSSPAASPEASPQATPRGATPRGEDRGEEPRGEEEARKASIWGSAIREKSPENRHRSIRIAEPGARSPR